LRTARGPAASAVWDFPGISGSGRDRIGGTGDRILALAARQTVQEGARTWRWRHAGRSLRRLGELVAWLAAGNVSGLLRGLSNGGVR